MQKRSNLFVLVPLLWLIMGCSMATLQPRGQTTEKSPWKSYSEANQSFRDTFQEGKTMLKDLENTLWDPQKIPNVQTLGNAASRKLFKSGENEGIRLNDLPLAVQNCLREENGKKCRTLVYDGKVENREGVSNPFLRALKFKREDLITGWFYKAIAMMQDTLFVYLDWDGKQNDEKTQKESNPLGPASDLGGILTRIPF